MVSALILSGIFFLTWPAVLFAQQRYFWSESGTSGTQAPNWTAKDLGLFEKYGLNVDLVFIPGGARGMQALLGGSTHIADSDGVAPINAVLRGGELVIVAGVINKSLFRFVAQKDVADPADLRGKKIGVANFGGSNEFAVLLALKRWNISREAVTLLAAGGSVTRLAAMAKGALDATVLPYALSQQAARLGMRVLADIPDLMPSFPDKVVTVRRSFLLKERDTVKRFLQAISEGIYQFNTNKEKGLTVYAKHLRTRDSKVLEENYSIYAGVFPLPPRVGREGLRNVVELILQRTPGAKADMDLGRFLDESVIDELEKEGFFKKFGAKESSG